MIKFTFNEGIHNHNVNDRDVSCTFNGFTMVLLFVLVLSPLPSGRSGTLEQVTECAIGLYETYTNLTSVDVCCNALQGEPEQLSDKVVVKS